MVRSTRCTSSTLSQKASKRTCAVSTTSAPPTRTTITRGVGHGRATRRSSVGSARPTKVASPIRSSSVGQRALPPLAKRAISTCTPSTCSQRCSSSLASCLRPKSTAWCRAPSRVSALRLLSTTARRPRSTSPSTTRCLVRVRCITTDGKPLRSTPCLPSTTAMVSTHTLRST